MCFRLGGVIFSFDPITNVYNVLYNFDSQYCSLPSGSLMQASNGKLYGMTWASFGNEGGIFSFDTSNNVCTKIFDFNFINGAYPYGDLIEMDSSLLNAVSNIVEETNSISIFPNPTKSSFSISLKNRVRNARAEIFNAFGEQVYSTEINGQHLIINAEFPQGIYFVKVSDEVKSFISKLIVQ